MPSYTQPPYLLDEVRVEYCDRTAPGPGILACEAPAVYRPRHPEAQVFYQVFEQHFDSYVTAYEERFEPRSGSLRRVVPETVERVQSLSKRTRSFLPQNSRISLQFSGKSDDKSA